MTGMAFGWMGSSRGLPILASIRLDVVERLAVHFSCAAIGFASGIGEAQNIRSINLVVQKIEPELGFCLSLQSVTYLVKYEWQEIAIFYSMARLADDVRLASAQSVTPDIAVHARKLLTLLGQPHKVYDGEPRSL
jgi:hypothetical protein